MRIRTVDAYTNEFDDIACRCEATFYHSRAWVEGLAVTYPHLSFRSLVAEDGGASTGFLPFFYLSRGPLRVAWSMPFGTYGGPAALDDQSVSALVDAYAGILASPLVIEAGWIDFGGGAPNEGWSRETSETHLIDLSDGFDKLWDQKIEQQRKKRTRRAQRLGITVRRGQSVDDANHYYDIYTGRVDEWGGGSKYPKRLFLELLERGGDSVRLYVAEHDGQIVGGHFNFYHRDTVTAWNGVTTPESNHLQPGTLLYMHCLQEACSEGFKLYNLGGSLGKRSLIDFKESLGGTVHQYSLYRRRSPLGRLAARFKEMGN